MNKTPVIRRGQRVPYRKGTQAQIDERVGYCVRLLAFDLTKTQIHRAVRKRFNIQYRQAARYLDLIYRGGKLVDRWHARARARKYCQIYQDEDYQKLRAVFSDAANA
jgi:hypothetical protein